MCAKGQGGPYPAVVREPRRDLKWSVMVLFLFQKYFYDPCLDDLLEVNLGIGNRKLVQ